MREQILPPHGPNRRPDQTPKQKAHLEKLAGHYAELTGLAPARVRRWISVMVLLGALDRSRESAPLFLLKGGVAIELRVGGVARATKDVDLVFWQEAFQAAAVALGSKGTDPTPPSVDLRQFHGRSALGRFVQP